ncbi:MAG: hypothetical protein U1D33_04750, partial [bacterium]|nr:hypothetical protein [bacterium]
RDEVLPRTYRSGHAEKTESVLSLSQRIHLNQRDNEDFDDLRFSPFGEDRLAKLLKINWQGDRVRLRKTAFDIFRTPGTTEERRVFALFAWFAARDTLPAESNMSDRSFVGWEMVKWAVDFSQNLRGYVAAHLLNHLGPVEKPSGFLTSLYSTLRGRTDIDPFLQIQLIRAFRHQVEAQSRMARGELSELAWSLFDILESRDFPFAVRVMAYTEGRGVAKRLDPEGAEKAEEKAWKRLEKLLFKDFPFAARFGPREDSYGGAYLPGLLSFKKPDALHATAAYLNLEGAAGIVEELLEDMGIVKGARQNSPICFNFELLVARFPTMSWLERTWYRMIG